MGVVHHRKACIQAPTMEKPLAKDAPNGIERFQDGVASALQEPACVEHREGEQLCGLLTGMWGE